MGDNEMVPDEEFDPSSVLLINHCSVTNCTKEAISYENLHWGAKWNPDQEPMVFITVVVGLCEEHELLPPDKEIPIVLTRLKS